MTTTNSAQADRPQPGDKIVLTTRPDISGYVLETFYRYGSGSTSVYLSDGSKSWPSSAHYSTLRVTERAAKEQA